MFDTLQMPAPDKILSVMTLFKEDERAGKIDLGVGVYRDGTGATPIMRAVREAERRLIATESTKSYVGPGGDPAFNAIITRLVFGDGGPLERCRAIQTPGGAGALSVLAAVLAETKPTPAVWMPDPTFINHEFIMEDAGLEAHFYPYFDPATCRVRFGAMVETLRHQAAEGDVLLLHGCCHNPCGADLDRNQWRVLADIIVERNLLPFIDLAYQGFGDGLEEDAHAVRMLADRVPQMMVASSCSKNFGLYRDRTGAALILADTAERAEIVRAQMMERAKIGYSMPPDHGGSVVRTILKDPALTVQWKQELEAMRRHVVTLRTKLADEFRRQTNSDRYDFLIEHRGMFSLIGTDAEQAERLRSDFGIYIVEDGRINVAGLHEDQIPRFVGAVLAVRN